MRVSSSSRAACGLAAGLVWYQGLLRQAARAQMHSALVRIDHVGVFACRNVNSEATGARSHRAAANAIDITAFHFADGRVAGIARDHGKPTAQGRFLEAAHAAACRYSTVYADPVTTDCTLSITIMGPYLICR